MCGTLDSVFHTIVGLSWLEIIKALAPVATAIIALLALKNWKRQDRAKREAEFLDTLIDTAHTYLAEVPKLIWLFEVAKIGMASHMPSGESDDNKIKGAILYIDQNGQRESKRLLEVLEAIQPITIRLRSLAAKGQIFKFKDYAKCQNAITLLTWQFDRIEAFMGILNQPTLNWDNPVVQKVLKDYIAINPDEIRKGLAENNVAILEFAQNAYQKIYA